MQHLIIIKHVPSLILRRLGLGGISGLVPLKNHSDDKKKQSNSLQAGDPTTRFLSEKGHSSEQMKHL